MFLSDSSLPLTPVEQPSLAWFTVPGFSSILPQKSLQVSPWRSAISISDNGTTVETDLISPLQPHSLQSLPPKSALSNLVQARKRAERDEATLSIGCLIPPAHFNQGPLALLSL